MIGYHIPHRLSSNPKKILPILIERCTTFEKSVAKIKKILYNEEATVKWRILL